MKAYKYYVVYEIWNNGNTIGKGTCEVMFARKICCKEDLEDIESRVLNKEGIPGGSNAVVVNYILMDEVEYESEG